MLRLLYNTYMPGFIQSFSGVFFLHHFALAKLATRGIRLTQSPLSCLIYIHQSSLDHFYGWTAYSPVSRDNMIEGWYEYFIATVICRHYGWPLIYGWLMQHWIFDISKNTKQLVPLNNSSTWHLERIKWIIKFTFQQKIWNASWSWMAFFKSIWNVLPAAKTLFFKPEYLKYKAWSS